MERQPTIIAEPWKPQHLLDDLQEMIDEQPDNYTNGDRTTLCMARSYLERYFTAEAEGRLMVLPCKVGDTVYSVDGKVAEAEEFHIDKRNVHITVHFECDYNCEHCAFNTWRQEYCGEYSCDGEWGEMTIPADEIGKTVFLTREEAEAALKGESK